MLRNCKISGVAFDVSAEELAIYQSLQVPVPQLHPQERLRRRMGFANQRHLFHRVCAGSGKKILTNYPPESSAPVYDVEYWFTDAWDQYATGRDYDFSRPFFDQYLDLMRVAPRPNLQRHPQYDENSDYTNYAGKNKNCYLIFDSDKSWDCFYSYSINSCRDVIDCFRVEECELCAECVDCSECYNCRELQNCSNCHDSAFLKNCIGCNNCLGCVNLRSKSYCLFNQQLGKEEYLQRVAALRLDTSAGIAQLRHKFSQHVLKFPRRFMEGVQNENVVGDYLTFSKNAINCFDSRKLWDCRNVVQAFDDAVNCIDCTEVGDGAELLYECCYTGYVAYGNRFCSHVLGQSSNLTYCYFTPNCKDSFGCVGLHYATNCILNKRYTPEEYEKLVPRIIEHMTSTGEWGEFFPAELSPFPYNLTHAHEFMPLTKEQALKMGYMWREIEQSEFSPSSYAVPDAIGEVEDGITEQVLACEKTKRNYKIQRLELALYRKLNFPVPKLCFDERHLRRLALRNPRTLAEINCSACRTKIQSVHTPRPARDVLCEKCFNESAG